MCRNCSWSWDIKELDCLFPVMDPFKYLRLPWWLQLHSWTAKKSAFGEQSGLRVVLHISKLTRIQDYVNYQLRYKYWKQWNQTRWPLRMQKQILHTQKASPMLRKHRPAKLLSGTSQEKYPDNSAGHGSVHDFPSVLLLPRDTNPIRSAVVGPGSQSGDSSVPPSTLPVGYWLSARLYSEFTPRAVRQDVMLHAGPADPDSPSSYTGTFRFRAWMHNKNTSVHEPFLLDLTRIRGHFTDITCISAAEWCYRLF